MKNDNLVFDYLYQNIGEDAANLYKDVLVAMNQEFYSKYFKYFDSYCGTLGMIEKNNNYKKIDYSDVYKLIDDYECKMKL